MSNLNSAVPEPSTSRAARNGLWVWLGAAVLTVITLALAAANAPARVRLLFIFSIGFGAIAGWVLAELADQMKAAPRPVIAAIGTVLIVLGLIGLTFESSRQFAIAQAASRQAGINELLAKRLSEQDDAPPEIREAAERARQQRQADFPSYLRHRVSPLGDWPAPWPFVFWVAELIAGAAAGAWTLLHFLSSTRPTGEMDGAELLR